MNNSKPIVIKTSYKNANAIISNHTIENNKYILISLRNKNELSMNDKSLFKTNPNQEKIKEIFNSYLKNNELFTHALLNNDIRGNYSPCKIINLKWVFKLKQIFNFSEKDKTVFVKEDIILKDLDIFYDFKELLPGNVENGEFFICNEIFYLTITQFFSDNAKKELDSNCLECEIFLKDKKGIIIIKDDIFLFDLPNDDVNQKKNFRKIISPRKNELIQKILNIDYDLDAFNWKELEYYTKTNNNKVNIENNNIIYKDNKSNISQNQINNKNLIKNGDGSNNNNNIINININNNIIIKEKEIKNLLLSLFNKQKELDEKKKKLDEMEKDLISIKSITLNKISPTLGLQNIGSTCYMNSTLQCMAHFLEVSEDILTWYKYKNDKKKKTRELSFEYAKMLDNLFFPKYQQKYYEPYKFKEIISSKNNLFAGMNPNDSKDLLNFLIETMHNELNELGENNNFFDDNQIVDQSNEFAILNYFKSYFAKNYHSILSKYLYGIQKTIQRCCKCTTTLYNFQVYNFLIFPLLDVKNFVTKNNIENGNIFFNYNNINNYILNLYDCFNYYGKIDFFTGENSIYCNKCNSLQNAHHRSLLHSVPAILCIILNRGKNNSDFKEKFNIYMELNLTNYVEENPNNAKYYLIGVVCHIGDNLNGHFFAYCRSHISSPWYKYNDALVGQSDEKEILNAVCPYILFYHKYT